MRHWIPLIHKTFNPFQPKQWKLHKPQAQNMIMIMIMYDQVSVMTKTVMCLLLKTKLLDNHCTVFFDNYFNSCELLEEMLYRDTYGAGK